MSDIGSIVNMPINQLQPNPLQPRGSMDQEELNDLVASIKQHGILEPLVVAHTPAGYQIVAGERRWKASKLAGLTEVPTIVKETSQRGMLEMAIIENVQRVDLNPLDRSKAFQRLIDEFHLNTSEVAERIGKSAAYVSNTLRLLSLPDALKDGLLAGAISEGHARALAAIEDTRLMVEAYKIVLRENASVRRAEELARRMKAELGKTTSDHRKSPILMSPEIDQWQERLQSVFGDNSKVKLTRSRTQTKVMIVLHGDPDKTQSQLNRILKISSTDHTK
jgi:ParB family transcriptional regulator, chromosome partitioning protein